MRITSLFTTTLASLLMSLALAACGPGPSSDDTSADDTAAPDANTTDTPDANTAVAKQLGDSCTPDQANPMAPGDCGAGMTCLQLGGGTNAWCSKTCTGATDTSCSTGYTGPGIPYCYLGVDFDNNGSADATYCGVICNDVAGDPMVCNPASACTGTCPGTLACTAPLNSGSPAMHVADGCQ